MVAVVGLMHSGSLSFPPMQVFGSSQDKVTDAERTRAKVVCLGIIYGESVLRDAPGVAALDQRRQGCPVLQDAAGEKPTALCVLWVLTFRGSGWHTRGALARPGCSGNGRDESSAALRRVSVS